MSNDIMSYKDKINELHQEITDSYKTSVQKAWVIGEMLELVKKSLPHGSFMNWVIDNCNFKISTAETYLNIKEKVNSQSLGNYNSITDCLNDINKKEIEQKQLEDKKAKQLESTRIRLFQERYKYGKRPYKWDNSWDVHYNEWYNEKKQQDERFRKLEEERERFRQEKLKEQQERKTDNSFDRLQDYLQSEQQKINERQKYNSQVKDLGTLFDVIEDYVIGLNNSQKLECYNNLIKYCKNKAIELNINS